MDSNMMYQEASRSQEETTRKFIIGVYAWMTAALILTGLTGLFVVSSPTLLMFIFGGNNLVFFALIIAELVLVVYLSRKVMHISTGMAKFWFALYAVLNGVTLSAVFLVYDLGTIGYTFLLAAALFAVMSLYGYFTKTDLTTIGNLFVMGLFGLIIATLFNVFYRSEALNLMLTYVGVFIFIGLIGYDTQRIKALSITTYNQGEEARVNAPILGAMILYLDFINLFIRLLRLMGKK